MTIKQNFKTYLGLFLIFPIAMVVFWLYHVPPSQTFLFLIGVCVFLWIPGDLARRIFDRDMSEKHQSIPVRILISLSVGTAIVPAFYQLCRFGGLPQLFYVLLAATFFAWLYFCVPSYMLKQTKQHVSYLSAVGALLVFILIMLHFSHFRDVKIQEQGLEFNLSAMTETYFHQGIVNALEKEYPPSPIYLSGTSDYSNYHLFMHLEVELFNRILKIDTIYLLFFFFPALYFLLLTQIVLIIFDRFYHSPIIGTLCAILFFGSGFSFIQGFLRTVPDSLPWVLFFKTTIWSLFTVNGMLPAVGVFVLIIYYLHVFFKKPDSKLVFLLALLAYTSYGFKSSMGFQVAACLFPIALVCIFYYHEHRKLGAHLLGVGCLAALFIALDLFIIRHGHGDIVFQLDPFGPFLESKRRLGMSFLPSGFNVLLFLLYLVSMLGVRMLAFSFLKKAYLRDLNILFLLVFLVSGLVVSEFFFLGKEGFFNNIVWFGVQSLLAGWVLVGISLKKLEETKGYDILVPAIIAVVILAFPSTIQFLHLRAKTTSWGVSKEDRELVSFLRKTPESLTVLHSPNIGHPSLVSHFAGQNSVLNPFRTFLSDHSAIDKRMADLSLFFAPETEEDRRTQILEKYNIDLVWINKTIQQENHLANSPRNIVFESPSHLLYRP